MPPKQLLFLMKFGTNFVKVTQPCKQPKLYFWLGQTRKVLGSPMVNHHLETQLVNMVNMNIVPLSVLSIVKVL
jgi:hypothetical protein